MNVLRITGGQGSGKTQTLLSIASAGWLLGRTCARVHTIKVTKNDLATLNDKLRSFDPHDIQVLSLDVESELSPKAQARLLQIAEAAGVKQLFLAYQE